MDARQFSLFLMSGRGARMALCCAATMIAASAYAQSTYPPPYSGGGMGPGMQGMPAAPYQPQQGMPGAPYAQQGMGGMSGMAGTSYPPRQGGPLQPGEAFVTRFSGSSRAGPQGAIDSSGPVGVIIGVSNPDEPPQGQHWVSKPIRTAVTAGETGQVFGVALDDQTPPNVYLTATAAFGLHTQQGGWMPGMWGPGGGPGTVWRLDAASGYRAMPFADLRFNGRPNSAAALGNIAYDRINKQFFVSDMETGMIHRIGRDGRDAGMFDHGAMGRMQFTDAESGQRGSLAPIPFDPASSARMQNCQGPFDQTPECWNIAASGRRVWGLGVRRDPMGEGARLYYGVWSSPAFGQTGWNQLSDDDKRNSVWSVRLGPGGDFDPSDVRREFLMPDFFSAPQDVQRAGFSQPVSDISFADCSDRPVMLVSERGGLRNLGLLAENAFATPGEARTLRYELDQNGAWRAVGRYDVGNDDRRNKGEPFIRANCAGGAAFGPAVQDMSGQAPPPNAAGGPAQYVWITGDNLCSPQGPCRLPQQGDAPQPAAMGAQQQQGETEADPSQVHGVQGNAADLIAELVPSQGQGGNKAQGAPSQALDAAYLIDVDQVIDAGGNLNEQELMRNDATRVGDIAIYQLCAVPAPVRPVTPGMPWVNPTYLIPPPPPNFIVPEHDPGFSHAQWASHGTRISHYRYGSHSPIWSHQRWRSHWSNWSHNRSESHNPRWSHNRYGSHNRWISGGHDERRSHNQYRSHATLWSHSPRISQGHLRSHSIGHDRRLSWHDLRRSQGHDIRRSQGHDIRRSQGHNPTISLGPIHRLDQSRGHNPVLSRGHRLPASPGHHDIYRSRGTTTHNAMISRGPIHNPTLSRGTIRHNLMLSRGTTRHNALQSRGTTRHNLSLSRGTRHNAIASRGTRHNAYASRGTRIHHPPRFQQQRLHRPQYQRQRFHTPRVQRQRFNAPRVQRQRFQRPAMQRRYTPQRSQRRLR